MQCDHQGRRAFGSRHGGAELVGGAAQHRKGAIARCPQRRIGADRNAGFEHCRVERWLGAGEFEIGLAELVQRGERVGTALVPRPRQRRLELLEAAQRHVRQQLLAVAEMPIGRRRADPGEARGLGESEAGRALLGDQFQGGADQRLAQIAVMIAARFVALAGFVLAPTHVKDAYMRAGAKSMLALPPPRRRPHNSGYEWMMFSVAATWYSCGILMGR